MTLINCLPTPRPFGEVAEPWQWKEIFYPVIPALEYMEASDSERKTLTPYEGPPRFWNTLHRGADKTSSIARLCNHILAFGRRPTPLRISVAAGDKKQAKFVRDAMFVEKQLNPWFGQYLTINQYDAKGPGGELRILSADADSAFGAGDDLIICDELTHWPSPDLWIALMSGEFKRAHCIVWIITNAGWKNTWQWDVLQEAKADPSNWRVFDEPGYKAGWNPPDRIEATRRTIIATSGSAQEALRLLDNFWISNKQGSAFDAEDIASMLSTEADSPLNVLQAA